MRNYLYLKALFIFFTIFWCNSAEHSDYDNCGIRYGCFGNPPNCVESKSCTILVTFAQKAVNGDVDFNLIASDMANSYAAVAIHNAKEMGGSTMFCYSYNSQTGVAMSQNTRFSSSILDQNDLTNITVEIIDGKMKCSFTRPKLTNIQDIDYDLTNQYYLLLAEGLLQEDSEQSLGFSLKYHNGDRIISDDKVDFSEWTPTTSTTEIITTSSNEATTSTTEVITSTTEAITSTTTEETTISTPNDTDDDYTGCGINQGCFGYPSNCVASKSCTILLTFVQQVENGGVDFNLISSSMTNSYAAMAIYNAKEMGGSAIFCYSHNSETGTGMSSNTNSYSTILDQNDLTDVSIEVNDGKMKCSFTRPKQTNIEGVDYDMTNQYYLLLAKGPLKDSNGENKGNLGFSLSYHTGGQIVSDEKVDFSEFGVITTTKTYLVMVHGCLMVIAWFVLAFFGMLVARYAKDIDRHLCGKLAWFRIHQICMSTTWILVITGVVLIFVEKGVKPLAIERIKTNAHSIIGLFSSILVFIQPFMAFMRPSPESPKRKIFNFSHNFVGLSALILAMTAILLATILDSAKLDQKVTLPVGAAALVSFVVYQGLLTSITLCAQKQRKNKLLKIILGVALLTGLILSCIMITYIIEADM